MGGPREGAMTRSITRRFHLNGKRRGDCRLRLGIAGDSATQDDARAAVGPSLDENRRNHAASQHEAWVRRIANALQQRIAAGAGLDGTLGGRLDVLPELRSSEIKSVSGQQPRGRFLLFGVFRPVRGQEQECQDVRQQRCRRRLFHENRPAQVENQPQPSAARLQQGVEGSTELIVVPKHFFIPEIIQKRKPLAATARRAGWVGSNILLNLVPESGRIMVLRDGVPESRESVLSKWQQTLFLRSTSIEARGWLIEVMKAVEAIRRPEFDLNDVYAFEAQLSALYPGNNNVRPKIRQQLQVLRDNGYLEFLGGGRYHLRSHAPERAT